MRNEIRQDSQIVRAIVQSRGHCVVSALRGEVTQRLAAELEQSIRAGKTVTESGGEIRAISILQESDAALRLLDDPGLGALVDDVIGPDAVLGEMEGFRGAIPKWRRDFHRVRRAVPTRYFRSGISLWIPLKSAEMQVLDGSQHLEEGADPAVFDFKTSAVAAEAGAVVVLEAGVCYRLSSPGDWLRLVFVRPWIKPEIFYSSAIDKERLARLGDRGRTWCGANSSLPTSIEEFLAIEEAALEGSAGRAKGSGI
jgi:hypothetical protein